MTSAVAQLFDAMAPTYDDLEPWYEHLYARPARASCAPTLGPAPPGGGRALDAGCGTGFQSALLTDLGWDDPRHRRLGRAARRGPPPPARAPGSRWPASRRCPSPTRCFDAVVCCGSTLSFVDDPARALAELGRVLRPGGRLLLDCEHRPSLDLAWTLASALSGDPLGYGVTAREAWRALFAGARPAPGLPRLRPALALHAARAVGRCWPPPGSRPCARGGCTASPTCCPPSCCTVSRSPRTLAAAFRALCRLDARVIGTAPARALANSLVILAERAQPSA